MRYLPPIPVGETTRRILIRDASVNALARWLICGTPEALGDVRASLENDPSFLQWTALRAGAGSLDIDAACDLWREHALEYLVWDESEQEESEQDESEQGKSGSEPDAWEAVSAETPRIPTEIDRRDHREPDASVPPVDLPVLAAKLRRLKALETRFDETLERAKLDAMAEFAAGAGHEINNPIAVIAGRSQLFLRTETDPKRRHDLALMDAQARRVYEMIADMRLFARPPEPEMRQFDLASLVAETLDALREEADRRSIGLRQTGATHLDATADRDQMAVVLRSLCKNAFESIRKNGTVEVRLDESDTHVRFHVIDDGPGIPDAVRPHLFDPYFSARQAGRGLGLGLSKAWRIVVSNHGGTIEAGKTEDGRTVLSVELGREGQDSSISLK